MSETVAAADPREDNRRRLVLGLPRSLLAFAIILGPAVLCNPWLLAEGFGLAPVLALEMISAMALLYLLQRREVGLGGTLFFYDLKRLARQGRTTLLRCLYGLFLLGALWLAYLDHVAKHGEIQNLFVPGRGMDLNALARLGMAFFGALLIVQSAALLVLTPAYLAGAIHEERERRTLELLFTTHLRDREIVLGKLLARVTHLGGVLLTGLPVLCLIQFWGGVDARLVVAAFVATGLSLLSAGSLSILCSVYVLNAAEPQTENRSKDGTHPPEWLVFTTTCLGRVPCLQYVGS